MSDLRVLDVGELQRSFAGAVLAPGRRGIRQRLESASTLSSIAGRPSSLDVSAAADVVAAFDFARAEGLEIAVRGGGHNPAGHCVCDDGLVIDLSAMRTVDVDADARIARSAGGATWLDFDSATQAFGLVTPGGIVGSTGVAGLALGGGIGHLTAQLGLTCDNIVGAELVIPDGTLIQARGDENAELLWGLQGRRRQLRRRDAPRISPASARASRRRPARVSRRRRPRCPARLPRRRRQLAGRPQLPGRARCGRDGAGAGHSAVLHGLGVRSGGAAGVAVGARARERRRRVETLPRRSSSSSTRRTGRTATTGKDTSSASSRTS